MEASPALDAYTLCSFESDFEGGGLYYTHPLTYSTVTIRFNVYIAFAALLCRMIV